jgi:hypothetical protein
MSGWQNVNESAKIGVSNEPETAQICPVPVGPPAKPPSPRLRLDRISDCKRELARLYRSARREEISTQTATRLAYLLNMMAQMIETSELEKRVEAIEKSRAS